jgi:hypothetical protein
MLFVGILFDILEIGQIYVAVCIAEIAGDKHTVPELIENKIPLHCQDCYHESEAKGRECQSFVIREYKCETLV